MKPSSQEPLFYTIPEYSRLMGTSPATTFRRIADGTIRTVRYGGRQLIPREVVQEIAARARYAE
jgi:hypothetical protein